MGIIQRPPTILHSLLPYNVRQKCMCSITNHGTLVLLKGKIAYNSKALNHDKTSDFCVMKIKPRRYIIHYVVHPTQFLLSNDRHRDPESTSAFPRSHSYVVQIRGRIKTKISGFIQCSIFTYTLTHFSIDSSFVKQ